MIAILTACHKRYDIFKAFLNSLPSDAYVICVGDDDENKITFTESKINGAYLVYPNKPVSKKWNYGLEFASKVPFQYLVITGSDDIFCADLWAWYKTLRVHYAGILDFYFLDYPTGKIKYYEGFVANRRGEPHGAGRAIHRSVLESANWKLWGDTLNEGLDASMTRTMREQHLTTEFIKLKEKGFVALDIKTKENIHKITEYSGRWLDHEERNWLLNKIGMQ